MTSKSSCGRTCLISIVLLAGFLVNGSVFAQDRETIESIDSRVQRIERVLDQSLLEQFQRVDSLRQENSSVTGVTGGNAAAGSAPAAVIVREGGPAIPVANLTEFGDGPKPPTRPLRDTATNAEKLAYNSAYDQLARGQVQESMKSFDSFLSQYPDGPYSDNAWYWQGEAMYAQRDFEMALRNFGVVINSFPQSPKIPDARLKIGFALYEQQQYPQARAILTGVQDDYPGRSASVLARKRLQRMDREGL